MLFEKAQCGQLELSASLGFEVMRMMLEEDIEQYAEPKGKHKTEGRTGYRHGIEKTTVVMGGKKVRVDRPMVRVMDSNGDLLLATLSLFVSEYPLNTAIMTKLLSGVCTRKYIRTIDRYTADTICTIKSEVRRRFIEGMDTLMQEFFTRAIDQDYPIILIDSLELGKMTMLAAMGIDSDGKKCVLGVTEGGIENSTVVKSLLEDPDQPRVGCLSPKALCTGRWESTPQSRNRNLRKIGSHSALPSAQETECAVLSARTRTGQCIHCYDYGLQGVRV